MKYHHQNPSPWPLALCLQISPEEESNSKAASSAACRDLQANKLIWFLPFDLILLLLRHSGDVARLGVKVQLFALLEWGGVAVERGIAFTNLQVVGDVYLVKHLAALRGGEVEGGVEVGREVHADLVRLLSGKEDEGN